MKKHLTLPELVRIWMQMRHEHAIFGNCIVLHGSSTSLRTDYPMRPMTIGG